MSQSVTTKQPHEVEAEKFLAELEQALKGGPNDGPLFMGYTLDNKVTGFWKRGLEWYTDGHPSEQCASVIKEGRGELAKDQRKHAKGTLLPKAREKICELRRMTAGLPNSFSDLMEKLDKAFANFEDRMSRFDFHLINASAAYAELAALLNEATQTIEEAKRQHEMALRAERRKTVEGWDEKFRELTKLAV